MESTLSFTAMLAIAITVLHMGKSPKMRKGNSRITEKGTRPKGQEKKAERAPHVHGPDCNH